MKHMCKMIISTCVFSIFFIFFIFRVVSGVKGQKMVQNEKKIMSVVLHISGWLSFMVHMCKMIISPSVFFIFFKCLIFQVVTVEVRVQKRVQNNNRFCSSHSIPQEQ